MTNPLNDDRIAWNAALAEYARLRSIADADDTQDKTKNERGKFIIDQHVDDYCDAMDAVIDLPAPDVASIAWKFRTAIERCDGFQFFDDYAAAIQRDLDRLAEAMSPQAAQQMEMGGTTERKDAA